MIFRGGNNFWSVEGSRALGCVELAPGTWVDLRRKEPNSSRNIEPPALTIAFVAVSILQARPSTGTSSCHAKAALVSERIGRMAYRDRGGAGSLIQASDLKQPIAAL